MTMTRHAFFLAAVLALSGTAAAHSELHSANWCSNGFVTYAGRFSFTAEEIRAELNRRQQESLQRCLDESGQPDPGAGGVGTCGIFDPPYETAVALAREACGAAGSPTPEANSPVVAFVLDPPTFNDPAHHETFKLDAGLSGICGVCFDEPIPSNPGHD